MDGQAELEADNDELYEHYRIVVDKGQGPMRLDKFLGLHVQNATRTKIQSGIDAEAIKVNEAPNKASYRVKPGDIVTLSLSAPPRSTDILPEDIPLNIVYEDEDLLVINKPAGMVVHPAYGNWTGTLVNALVFHFQNLPTSRNGAVRPGLVHRIDKDTSGLMVIAKSELAMAHLAAQFYEHTIERTYLALVWGVPKEPKGTITGNVGRSPKDRRIMTVFPDNLQGKHAVTHYEVLTPLTNVAWVKCRLETGRTHQIRAHMQFLGHPLFADSAYGGDKIRRGSLTGSYKAFIENCLRILPRQALHAQTLGFKHPRSHERLQFEAALPNDMSEVLERWVQYANNN